MPTRKVRPIDGKLDVGGIEIPVALLTTYEGGEPTRKGITVVNERVSSLLMHGDDTPVEYNIAVFVSREPLTDRERAAIAVYVAGVDGRRDEKERKEDQRQRREKDQMFQLGQQAGAQVFDKLGAIAPALDAIEKLGMRVSSNNK